MPPREPPPDAANDPADPRAFEPRAFAAEGARLAAEGTAIADEMRNVLADALAAVLADPVELAALSAATARDAVEFLVRLGRMGRAEGEAVVRRAGGAGAESDA